MSDIEHVTGSDNVFADLGLSNPDVRLQKADLAIRIIQTIEARKLTQIEASKILGIDQPKVSAIKRGRLKDFSVERLMVYLSRLGDPHEIKPVVSVKCFQLSCVTPKMLIASPKGQGAISQSFIPSSEVFLTFFREGDPGILTFLGLSANRETRRYDQNLLRISPQMSFQQQIGR